MSKKQLSEHPEAVRARSRYYADQAVNQERARKYQSAIRKNEPKRFLVNKARERAREKGLAFSITPDDIDIPTVCPILGLVLRHSTGPGAGPESPSLDRIDPTKDYTPDNIQVISHKANAMKQNATREELNSFAAWVNDRDVVEYAWG